MSNASFARPARSSFVTTSPRGLDPRSPALRLFQKAKRLGVWDPQAIDLARDRADWATFDARQRDLVTHLLALFQAGEEGVTLDLLPLVLAIAREGRIEEEIYLTSFLFEEAKHVEYMRRFLDEVCGAGDRDLAAAYHTPSYRKIFYEALPEAMNRLLTDSSPGAQAVASATYNMIVEGVLAETGYHAVFTAFKGNGLMPGLTEGMGKMMRDESRHVAYGVFLLSRLIAEHEGIHEVVEARMAELLPHALGMIEEVLSRHEPDPPFGITRDAFLGYALEQFGRRQERLARSRGKTLVEVVEMADRALAEEAAT